jgi:hypothetical protein
MERKCLICGTMIAEGPCCKIDQGTIDRKSGFISECLTFLYAHEECIRIAKELFRTKSEYGS